MTLSTYIAALILIAIIAIIAALILALAWGVRKELEHTDEWWQPSEAGKLAKERFDQKQADADAKKVLRFANKPKYQQPNRSES